MSPHPWQNPVSGDRVSAPIDMRTCEKVVFIGGAGHSGSTLLGLMLGASPDVFYAGEARKSLFLGDESKPQKKRVCKLCGPACPVWGDMRPPRELEHDLYETLARRTGRSTVVDSTKNLAWIDAQLAALEGTGTARALIFLSRDGRAVVSSRVRKYPGTPVRTHASDWVAQIRATEALAARFPGPVLRVRYEELASRTEPSMRRVAELAGVAFDAAMLAPWTTEQHPLGGNNGTQFLLAREREQSGGVVRLSDKTRDHYATHPRGIVLDLRWREEMSAEARAAFDEVAAEVNVPYAWDEESA